MKPIDLMSFFHKPCKDWTIKIESCGLTFFITDIAFKDIAEAAAAGIQQQNPDATIKVYLARTPEEQNPQP